MAVTEQMQLRRPAATLTLRTLPPDLVVLQEAEIPSEVLYPAAAAAAKARQGGAAECLESAAGADRGGRRHSPIPRSGRRPLLPSRPFPAPPSTMAASPCRSGEPDAPADAEDAFRESVGSDPAGQVRPLRRPKTSGRGAGLPTLSGRTSSISCAAQSRMTALRKSSTSSSRRQRNMGSIPSAGRSCRWSSPRTGRRSGAWSSSSGSMASG